MINIVPKKFHSLIKFTKLVLSKDTDISYDDVSIVTNIIKDKIDSGMTPKDIQNFYNIEYTDFGMF